MLVLNCCAEELISVSMNNRMGNGTQLVEGVSNDGNDENWSSSSAEPSSAKDSWIEW